MFLWCESCVSQVPPDFAEMIVRMPDTAGETKSAPTSERPSFLEKLAQAEARLPSGDAWDG